jgi:insulysin
MDYVELMRKSGHPKHVFEELKTMAALDEIYASKGEGMWRATQLANEVMMFSLEDAGRTNYIYSDNSSKTYDDLLSHITPDNMLTMLIAKGVKTDTVEHFYQAPYSYLEDDGFYKELIETREYSELTIPEINPFIPKKASVPKRKLDDGVLPKKVESGNGTSLYFGQDHEFLRPKGVISLKVLFPKDKMSVEHRVRSRVYSACVRESLNELSYPAKQAGLNYSIREGYEGIFVDVNGYTESAIKLYESMLDHMTNFSITEKQFEAIKDKVVRDYENFSLSDAHIQTRELAPDLFYKYKYTWKEALPIAKGTTLEDIRQYSSSLYERTFLEAMVYGDFVKEDGKKVVSLFKSKTKTKPIEREEAFEIDYLDLSEKETIQYVEELLVNNSCFYRKYKIGEDTPENRALATLISKAIEQPFYTEMRTNQQLGYIVWSYPRSYDETYYLNLVIQSGVYPADELNKRVDTFVSGSVDIINQLDDETFQQLIDSAIEQLERKPMSISERATKHKNLIFEHGGDFDRDQKTIESLRVAKKETVAEHLRTMVSEDSRNMVNILGFAENHENTTGMTSSFSDLGEWKSTRVYK